MGDGYSNPVVGAGGDLIRAAIRSLNYRLGLTGWTINQDGSAEFNNVTVRGTVLGAIFRSLNFLTGVSGFELNGITGVAEFNNITARGYVSTGFAPDPRVILTTDGGLPVTSAFIELWGGLEDNPATMKNERVNIFGTDFWTMSIASAWANIFGPGVIELHAESAADGPGIWFVNNGTKMGNINFDSLYRLRLFNGQGVSPGSVDHPFQIGVDSGPNIRVDGDEIQFADNGLAADGKINESGGNVTFGGQTLGMTNFESGSFTAAATPGGAGGTSSTAVNFTHTFPATPRIFLCPRVSAAGSAALRMFGVTAAGTGGFTCNLNRTDLNTTLFDYFAISGLG